MAYVKDVTLGRGHFWLKGYNLNKLSRFIRLCLMPKIKVLGLMISDKKIFSMFPYISLCKECDPGAGAFWPSGII